MNTTLNPREVDKPFVQRWLRVAAVLMLRSPFRFGVLIALLGGLDTLTVNVTAGFVIDEVWVDRLGIVALPMLWVLVSAVARGADVRAQTWASLANLGRRSVWLGALAIGVPMAALSWVFYAVLHVATPAHHFAPYLRQQGDLLASIEASVVLIVGAGGITYCPLLALVPGISAHEARGLSQQADRLNGFIVIMTMTGILALGAIFVTSAIPAYGMTTAAFLVYFGVMNYVAYRDIFERRADNLPQQVVTPQIVTPQIVTPQVTVTAEARASSAAPGRHRIVRRSGGGCNERERRRGIQARNTSV